MALPLALQKQLEDIGQRIVDQVRDDIKNKKVTRYGAVNASGNLAKSVQFEIFDTGMRVTADDYVRYLEFGRGPTKNGKGGILKPIIRKWIDDKGIVPRDGISKDSLAYLITRKIHREGTTIFQQGGSFLLSDILKGAFLGDIIKELEDSIINEVTSDLFEALEA